ncbi:MAG: hypothetical protein QM617_13820 [Comamonas sp.]
MEVKTFIFLGFWADYEVLCIQQACDDAYRVRQFDPSRALREHPPLGLPRVLVKPLRGLLERRLLREQFERHPDAIFVMLDSPLLESALRVCPTTACIHVLMRNTLRVGSRVGQAVLAARDSGCPVWSFDPDDCARHRFHPYAQFVARVAGIGGSVSTPFDLVFIGQDKGRSTLLQGIQQQAEAAGLRCHIDIRTHRKRTSRADRNIPYADYLRLQCQGRCIIDIVKPGQAGLTLRPLEAALYQRKLLTNSAVVRTLPFYHPDNILLFDEARPLTPERLRRFMDAPLQPVAPEQLAAFSLPHLLRQMIRVA